MTFIRDREGERNGTCREFGLDKGKIDLSRDCVRAGMEYEIERGRKVRKMVFRVQTKYYSSY